MESIQPLVINSLKGFNNTFISIGPDLEGFTYKLNSEDIIGENRSILPRIISDIFFEINKYSQKSLYSVQLSLYEIYNEEIHDLLDPKQNNKLKVRDCGNNGVQIVNLTHVLSYNEDDLLELIINGLSRRTEPYNGQYSRSHTILQLDIVNLKKEDMEVVLGTIKIVDLACIY